MSATRSALIEKLARLQRQSGAGLGTGGMPRIASPAEAQQITTGSAASTVEPDRATSRSEIDRLRRLLARRPAQPAASAPARPLTSIDRELPGQRLAPGLRCVEKWIDCELPAATTMPERFDGAPIARDRWLCFDTETTGLAGGSGTRAFMIGAADWIDGRLRLRQLYLDAMAGEPAMLDTFAGWLEPHRALVSYNGRCYDAPLLATRFRLARRANPLAGLPHVDLLYPVRRRYRGCWENCRLATVERHLLQVVREDDLPGAQAPAAWLQFLRGGSAHGLRRVLQHNAQDIVSLARLLCLLHHESPPPAGEAGALHWTDASRHPAGT